MCCETPTIFITSLSVTDRLYGPIEHFLSGKPCAARLTARALLTENAEADGAD